MGELCNLNVCVIKHTLVGTVYRQEKDSKMKSVVLKSVEVLQTITAQAVQERGEEDVRAVTQKTGSKNSRMKGLEPDVSSRALS